MKKTKPAKRPSNKFSVATRLSSLVRGLGKSKNGGCQHLDDMVAQVVKVRDELSATRRWIEDMLKQHDAIFDQQSTNPRKPYEDLIRELQRNGKVAEGIRASVANLEKSAAAFFDQWSRSFEGYTDQALRERSGSRLEFTRGRYREIPMTSEAAQEQCVSFLSTLSDQILFLAHDFNAESIAELRESARLSKDRQLKVTQLFDEAIRAAEEYIKSVAGPGQSEESLMRSRHGRGTKKSKGLQEIAEPSAIASEDEFGGSESTAENAA